MTRDMPREDFAGRLEELQKAFDAETGRTVTIGYCVGSPQNEREVRAMISAADGTLFQSKAIARGSILETSAFSDSPQIRNDILRLEDLGYLVWLDDFGSGMSSLNTLKDLRVNAAKIDLEFLRDSEKNPKAFAILKYMIQLMHSIDTIALVEGVETKEQLEFVRQCGGNLIQGFYFSKPQDLKAEELSTFLDHSISKAEYDYYARAAFIDIDKSPGVVFEGIPMSDIAFQIEKEGESLIYLRVSDRAREWADKFGFTIEQRGPVYLGSGDFNRSVRAAIADADENDRDAYVSMPLPDGQSCWLCISIVSRQEGTDRIIIMGSVVNKIHPTVDAA